jgi:hypothetical protein
LLGHVEVGFGEADFDGAAENFFLGLRLNLVLCDTFELEIECLLLDEEVGVERAASE